MRCAGWFVWLFLALSEHSLVFAEEPAEVGEFNAQGSVGHPESVQSQEDLDVHAANERYRQQLAEMQRRQAAPTETEIPHDHVGSTQGGHAFGHQRTHVAQDTAPETIVYASEELEPPQPPPHSQPESDQQQPEGSVRNEAFQANPEPQVHQEHQSQNHPPQHEYQEPPNQEQYYEQIQPQHHGQETHQPQNQEQYQPQHQQHYEQPQHQQQHQAQYDEQLQHQEQQRYEQHQEQHPPQHQEQHYAQQQQHPVHQPQYQEQPQQHYEAKQYEQQYQPQHSEPHEQQHQPQQHAEAQQYEQQYQPPQPQYQEQHQAQQHYEQQQYEQPHQEQPYQEHHEPQYQEYAQQQYQEHQPQHQEPQQPQYEQQVQHPQHSEQIQEQIVEEVNEHQVDQQELVRQQAEAERLQREREEEEDRQEALRVYEEQQRERQRKKDELEQKRRQDEEAQLAQAKSEEEERLRLQAELLLQQEQQQEEQARQAQQLLIQQETLEQQAREEKQREKARLELEAQAAELQRLQEEAVLQKAQEESHMPKQQQQQEQQIEEQERQEQERRRKEEEEDMQEQQRLYDEQLKTKRSREAKEAEDLEFERYNQQLIAQEEARMRKKQEQQQQPEQHQQHQQHQQHEQDHHQEHQAQQQRGNVQHGTREHASAPREQHVGGSERTLPTQKTTVYGQLLHVVFHFSPSSDVSAQLSLANALMNRGHKVSYAGDRNILQHVMDRISPEDDSKFFIIEDADRSDGPSEDQELYSALPKALTPALAYLPWFEGGSKNSFESLRQQMSNAAVDLVVADSYAVDCMDAAETLGIRTAVFQSVPLAWLANSKTWFALSFAERLVGELWNVLAPFARLIPTAFVNYQRWTRELPPLGDVQDYWARSLNLVASADLLPSNFRRVGNLARPEPVLDNDTRVLEFIAAREAQGVPVIYVNFGSTWLSPRLVEAILWGLVDSRWAVVMNLPAAMEAAIQKDNLPPDRRGNKYVMCAFDAHVKVLQQHNVKGFLSHGGSELTNSALLFGVPSFLVPLTASQAQHAQTLQQHGAAIVATSDRQLSTTIAASVWRLLSDPSLKESAEKLGLELRGSAEDASVFLEQAAAGEWDELSMGELALPFWRRWNLDIWGVCLLIFLPVWFIIGALGELFTACWDLCCPRICCCLCCSFKPRVARGAKQGPKPSTGSKLPPVDLASKKLQ